MKNQLSVCDICGRNHERSNLVIIDTVAVCPECTFICFIFKRHLTESTK